MNILALEWMLADGEGCTPCRKHEGARATRPDGIG